MKVSSLFGGLLLVPLNTITESYSDSQSWTAVPVVDFATEEGMVAADPHFRTATPVVLRNSGLFARSLLWSIPYLAREAVASELFPVYTHPSGKMLYTTFDPSAPQFNLSSCDAATKERRSFRAFSAVATQAVLGHEAPVYLQTLLMALPRLPASGEDARAALPPWARRIADDVAHWQWDLLGRLGRTHGLFRPRTVVAAPPALRAAYAAGGAAPLQAALWAAGGGARTPLHIDWADNLFGQLAGSKRFALLPPAAAAAVYPYPEVRV